MKNPMDSRTRRLIQLSLFFTFLGIFIATSVLTLGASFGFIQGASVATTRTLLAATILEVAAGIIALWYAVFGLKRDGLETEFFNVYGTGVCLAWAQFAQGDDVRGYLREAKKYVENAEAFVSGGKLVDGLIADFDSGADANDLHGRIKAINTFFHGQLARKAAEDDAE